MKKGESYFLRDLLVVSSVITNKHENDVHQIRKCICRKETVNENF